MYECAQSEGFHEISIPDPLLIKLVDGLPGMLGILLGVVTFVKLLYWLLLPSITIFSKSILYKIQRLKLNPNLEVCTFTLEDFNKAIQYNISRVELCKNKDEGGITPTKTDIEYALSKNIPIHPIIRPRGGDFIYNNEEIKIMVDSISFCKEVGCKGIVFGVLDKKNNIDIIKCRDLIREANGMSLTFHMAFDQVDNPF